MKRSQVTLNLIARTFDRVKDEPDRQMAARVLTRSATIVGLMLEGMADKRHLPKRPGTLLARAGRTGWFLVEVAVPHSLGSLLFGYWLVLLYVAGLVMLVAGLLGAEHGVLLFALEFLGATVAAHAATWLLNRWFQRRSMAWVAAAVGALVVLAATVAVLISRSKTWGLLDTTKVTLRQAGWAIPIAVLLLAVLASGWDRWQRYRTHRGAVRAPRPAATAAPVAAPPPPPQAPPPPQVAGTAAP